MAKLQSTLLLVLGVISGFFARVAIACPLECTCSSISGNFCPGLKSPPKSDILIASSTDWYFENGGFDFIPANTFGNTLITKLSFRNGKLKSLPDGVFKNLKDLKELDLSNNQLSYVRRETFEGLESLEKLNLSNNFMWTYDPDVLKYLPSLRILDIGSNQLSCDSGTKGLKRYTEEYLVTIPANNLCRRPEQLKGLAFAEVPTKEFRNYQSEFPVFQMSPSLRQIVFEDDQLPLNCSVSINNLDMQLTWLHDNQPVPISVPDSQSGSQVQTRFYETSVESHGILTSMLVISNLKHEDTGRWQCRVKDSGEKVTEVSLDVMVLENSAVFCPKGVTYSNKGTFTWPKTVAGFSHPQYVLCPHGKSAGYSSSAGQAKATRTCDHSGQWSSVDDSACGFRNPISRVLSELPQVRITKDNYLEELEKLVNATAKAYLMENVDDVNFVSQVVSNVWNFVNEDDMHFIGVLHNKIAENLLKVVSNLMAAREDLLSRSEFYWKSCSTIISRLENFATLSSNMAEETHLFSSANAILRTIRIESSQANVRSYLTKDEGVSCVLTVPKDLNPNLSDIDFQSTQLNCESPAVNATKLMDLPKSRNEKFLAGISFPRQLFQFSESFKVSQTQFFKLHIIVLKNSSIFPDKSDQGDQRFQRHQIGPTILSNTMVGDKNNLGVEISGSPGSKIQLSLTSESPKTSALLQIQTWSPARSSWLNSGCSLIPSTLFENVTCAECGSQGVYSVAHSEFMNSQQGLYFWHLVQRVEPAVQLGTALCVVLCIFIVITYALFYRQISMRSRSIHTIMNITISIVLLVSLFAWGLFFTLQSPPSLVGCKLLGVSLHYFTLSTATWMLIFCADVSRIFDPKSRRNYNINNDSFSQIAHDKPPSLNGAPNSNVSGSSQNMSVASHRSKAAGKTDNFGDMHEGVRRKRKTSSFVKLYVIGWGAPAILCVVTGLASVAFHGDNQFCWIESELIILTLVAPAAIATILSSLLLLKVVFAVPEDCCSQSAIKKDHNPVNDKPSQFGPSECFMIQERYPAHAASFVSQNHSTNHNGSTFFYYPGIDSMQDSSSGTMTCKPVAIVPKMDHDCVLSEAESLIHAASMHSNQSNSGGVVVGIPTGSSEVHPMHVVPTGHYDSVHMRNSMAFKTNNSALTPTNLPSNSDSKRRCHHRVRSAIVLFVTTTFSWLFGALILFYDKQCHWVFSYLYAISCALLGVFLFLNYCVLRNDVKNCYYALFCNRKLVATSNRTASGGHATYQMRSYPANFCSDRKSSQSSLDSGYTKSGIYYARRSKSCRNTPTPHTGSYYLENTGRSVDFQNNHYASGSSAHNYGTNPSMNQVLYNHSGRVVALHNVNPRSGGGANIAHVRSAHAINRTMGTTSRSGSSVREFDLVSLPEHVAVPGNNIILNSPQQMGQLSNRSQSSINEALIGSQIPNGMSSDHDSQKSQLTPGGHNTPVSSAHVQITGRFSPPRFSGHPNLVDSSSKGRQPLNYKNKDRSTPNLSHKRSLEGPTRGSRGHKGHPHQHAQVPVAAILPVRQTFTPDILKVSSSTGLFSGLSNTSGSKADLESDVCDESYSSSDDDESTCSFPGKQQQQFRKLIASNSRSTVVSSDKGESCV